MKLLLDFFPLLGFFIAYKMYDIYTATAVLIAGAFVQTFGHWLMKRQFEKMHLFTLILASVFGGLTLFLRDDTFIKWKVSIFLWLITLVFLFRQWFQQRISLKDLLESIFGESLGVADNIWKNLNYVWAITSLVTGFLNLWVAYYFSQSDWVNFKVWGVTGIQMALMIATIAILLKHMPEDKKKTFGEEAATDKETEKES